MEVKYDIPKYITSVRMSLKKRVLVEGRDDKAHIKNLLDVILGPHKVKIDSVENIRGDCSVTAKNNKAKIEKIHKACNGSAQHSNLYFLSDREYYKFDISSQIVDLMTQHESLGNFSWTIGHSLENYFIESDIICDAYRYLSGSELKSEAIGIFKSILPTAVKVIAAITLAARDINKSSYPLGTIMWSDFKVTNNLLQFDIENWKEGDSAIIVSDFRKSFNSFMPIVEVSDILVCSRICRGHTAMQMLQRVFASCLYTAGSEIDEEIAIKAAHEFSKLKESTVSGALSEAWVRSIRSGSENYPTNLVSSIA